MSRSANVRSLDAVEAFTTALRQFQEEASGALGELELQVGRALEWIQHDRKDYWRDRVRRGWDEVAEAKANLERCLMFPVADRRPSCYDEKVALAKAKRRLRIAEEKVEAVRRWTRAVAHEVDEYRGNVGQISHWLQSDAPRAIAVLESLSRALESYVAVKSDEKTAISAEDVFEEGDAEEEP